MNLITCCVLPSSTRRKDGCSASDSESTELIAVGLQRVNGNECSAIPTSDTALAATRLTAKPRMQTRLKVGRHRIVARSDGRPRRPLQRQSVNQSCLSEASSSGPPNVSDTAIAGDNVTDVVELTTLSTNSDGNHFVLC